MAAARTDFWEEPYQAGCFLSRVPFVLEGWGNARRCRLLTSTTALGASYDNTVYAVQLGGT